MDCDVHEISRMKKGALTFEEPLQPNRLIHALVYATTSKEVTLGHKKTCVLQAM